MSLDLEPPDLTAWVQLTADTVRPLVAEMWRTGMVAAGARMAAKLGLPPPGQILIPPTGSVLGEVRPVGIEGIAVPDPMDGIRRIEVGNEAVFGLPVRESALLREAKEPTLERERATRPGAPLGQGTLFLKGGRYIVCKAGRKKKKKKPKPADVDFVFDLHHPAVADAVDQLTLAFCRDTMATATGKLSTALERLRKLLKRGLPRGKAVEVLAIEVRRIFADPARAFRIATTESSRAIHGGQAMAAVAAGVKKHTWLASADACPLCLKLDGKTVKIGKPFWVDPKGGPYAIILYPPAHPHCFCTTVEVL